VAKFQVQVTVEAVDLHAMMTTLNKAQVEFTIVALDDEEETTVKPKRELPRNSKVQNLIMDFLEDGGECTLEEVGAFLEENSYAATSASPGLSQLAQAGKVQRVGKRTYKKI